MILRIKTKIKVSIFVLIAMIFTVSNTFGQRKDANAKHDSIYHHFKTKELDSVKVQNKSPIQGIRESPFNVVVLDAKVNYNSTMQLSDLLNRASGVKVRQSGGLGSSTSISLNGFTGRSVKLFMDGVPMSGFGSAFQLNNIPVNIADRIEIYKGVVPIEFGTDAMGGVINIVTNQSASTFVDASYSYGSFNTHKANLSFGHTTNSGFSFLVNAFMNYSDNNYKMHLDQMTFFSDDGKITTTETGDFWAKRFNDRYRSQTAQLKVGFVKKWWADRFFLGLTAAHEDAGVQNATVVDIVYGKRSTSSNSFLPSLEYEKRNFLLKGMHFKLTGNYNHSTNKSIDTAARQYNWLGQYRVKSSKGENGENTLSDFYNNNVTSTANLAYNIDDKSSIAVNNVISGYRRKNSTTANVDEASAADTMRRESKNDVLGIAYRYRYNKKLSFNAFGKYYYQNVTGPKDTSTSSARYSYTEMQKTFSASGYGIAATYFLNEEMQLKASFERALQLPTETQLFGDEVLTTANSSLTPEKSMNYNLGATLNKTIDKDNTIYIDVNGYYRWTTDFIRQVQNSRYGTIGYVNFGRVSTWGIDGEIHFYHKNQWTLGATVTYMDKRNKGQLRDAQSSVEDVTYNDRMPNIPFFFGNGDAAYYIHNFLGKGNTLNLGYTFNFIGMFYLNFESLGDKSTKYNLPSQLSHDFTASYTLKHGRYNIGFEALDFTDARLFDNWSLQKPGRRFSIKFRYFFRQKDKEQKNKKFQ
ncbi:MAG: energy transducer TonB [Pseudopedobacter saltans]|uniref:Energy transducer TonB n=1 Tax=Pseudopedobacter saltans TaxID=151895 RepID=A0A2W5F7Y5_9SPHI|nr:MAG: energy transducer TonB [Pseudopedobacter saltans]